MKTLPMTNVMIVAATLWASSPAGAAEPSPDTAGTVKQVETKQDSGLPLIFDLAAGSSTVQKKDGAGGISGTATEKDTGNGYQFDLGEVREIRRTEICFVEAEKAHAYMLEYSINGKLWHPCGIHKKAVVQSPHVDTVNLRARFLRVTVLSGTPGVVGFKAFGGEPVKVADLPENGYLFAYFVDKGHSGLHLDWSRDGFTWNALNSGRSYLKSYLGASPKREPNAVMRDPHLSRGPDGTFHLLWTIPGNPWGIGYSSSKNLIDWSEQRILPVMKSEKKCNNCWAPEAYYDDATKQFLILWSSTIPGRFPETDPAPDAKKNHGNHRIYYVTTTDFVTLSEPKIFHNPGYNCIDATILKRGGKYYMVFKDEQIEPKQKFLLSTVGDSATGPFQVISKPFTTTWTEGASLIEMGDYVYCYYDYYGGGRYGVTRSKDMIQWEDISKDLSLPKGLHHGSIITAPRKLLESLVGMEKK